VEVVCYCLLPNHFHFILQQRTENGISDFMRKLSTGYTKYFNKKNERSGHLFQGAFKAVAVETDEQLLYLSGYINGNVEIHKIGKAEDWEWGSYKDYIGKRNGATCNKKIILDEFKHIKDYQEYVKIVMRESGQRKEEVKSHELG
jgi:putative transposase